MDTTEIIVIAIITLVLMLVIGYYVIKMAFLYALRQFGYENRSPNDKDIMQIKLLVEIAKKNGLDNDSIDAILIPHKK